MSYNIRTSYREFLMGDINKNGDYIRWCAERYMDGEVDLAEWQHFLYRYLV